MRRVLFFVYALFVAGLASYGQSQNDEEERPVRHYMDIQIAGGVSHWNYPLNGGTVTIGGAYNIGIGYTFFFHPNVGLQSGVSISRLASNARLTERMEWRHWQDGTPLTDYMGEVYTHRATFENWLEKQQVFLFEIPIGLRFRYFKNRDSRAGLHAALGIKAAIPLWANYRHSSGTITHTGWYEQWQLLLHDLPGRFETEVLSAPQEESMTQRLHVINAELYTEIGTAIRINTHYELYIAAFGQYMVNNLNAIGMDDRTALGFRTGKNTYPFMNEYRGVIGTDQTGTIHPWMAGIKIGLSLWPGKTDDERKEELKKLMKQYPEVVHSRIVHDTVVLHDTICPETNMANGYRIEPSRQMEQTDETAHQALDSLLSEAVIWFHWDAYVPILEPAYILDSVAAMMQRHPSLRIHVNGHACRLGTDRYNQRLALLRAKAVAELLEQKGVSADRMFIWSYGSNRPYRYNSKKQLSKDRRVELIPDPVSR